MLGGVGGLNGSVIADIAEWTNAIGLRPILLGVHRFESHYPHLVKGMM